MYQPSRVLVFALGCIGALAPEIVRFYRQRHKPPKSLFSLWYLLISAAFAALGGVVAIALPAVTLWGALYAGITTPVLISSAAKHREKAIYAANEVPRQDSMLQAHDMTPTKWKKAIEFFREHADDLFI